MSAAAEWPSGIFTLARMEATIAASWSVHPVCTDAKYHLSNRVGAIGGCAHVQQREDNPFEYRTGLVHRPFQALVVMYVELSVIFIFPCTFARQSNVFSDSVQKNDLEEEARLWRFHLRNEYAGCGMTCLGGPILGVRKREYA